MAVDTLDAMPDGPDADGCALDFTEAPDDEETAALRALFPDGDPGKAAEYHALFTEVTG